MKTNQQMGVIWIIWMIQLQSDTLFFIGNSTIFTEIEIVICCIICYWEKSFLTVSDSVGLHLSHWCGFSCREPRLNRWTSAGRCVLIASSPVPHNRMTADCNQLMLHWPLAAQWPQQQQRRHSRWGDDPQETPQLDRRPRWQLLPCHSGNQVGTIDPLVPSD